ncbi:maternal effect protein oskar [Drosophila bipectinata]|uniref:maternal effect protein oskar n=1 Tax=Drosophila bipectinata TaxID=42026 RepID=UPI001C894637|nr:maternal effect protein oskar [Drosophila bipectinata]
MAAVTSELPREPTTTTNTKSDRLRAVKKRVTTCLQQWCQKLQQPASFRKSSSSRFYRIFVKADYTAIGDKFKSVRQFHKIFKAGRKKREEPAESVDERQQLQFVARLFSSTLISTEEIYGNGKTSYSSRKSQSYNSNSMTIIESNYIAVREENPDIDAEVRAILLSHAQNGITISSIKSEYRKQTGNTFPLHDNVTDFLLTIPYVTAECSETGKRIFNMKPNKDNRHLYDMVLNQKPRNDCSSGPPSSVEYNRPVGQRGPPRHWRYQYKRRAQSPLENTNQIKQLNTEQNGMEKLQDNVQIRAITTNSATLQKLAKAAGESNWCYQDNWNHLNNFYQQNNVNGPQNPVPPNIYIDTPDQHTQVTDPELLHCQNRNPSQNQNYHQDIYNNHNRDMLEFKRPRDLTPTPTTTSGTQNDSMMTISSDFDAFLLDFPLMGDDFFLYLARMELNCRFKRYERVLQSGLCVSGQTIIGARNRFRKVYLPENTQIIVNIGSVDIMRGKPLVQIEHDFRLLIKEIHSRRCIPILTNLAPLANYCHDKVLCDKISKFNKFVRNEARSHLKFIDINSCLINEKKNVLFDCFQSAPRTVTGSKEPYLFWNKIGRQRVLQTIESCLEY